MATEAVRQNLEDIEHLERAGAICLAEQDKHAGNPRKRILWDHRVLFTANELAKKAKVILEQFEDADKLWAEELAAMAGQRPVAPVAQPGRPQPPPDGGNREMWRNYYDRLKQIQDYYKSFGAQNEFPETRDANYFVLEAINAVPGLSSIFSAEEARGRVLDLSQAFNNFVNCKKCRQHREYEHRQATLARLRRRLKREVDLNDPEVRKKLEFTEMDYVRFIRTVLVDFRSVPRHCKYRDHDYWVYITELVAYLESFYVRSAPLVDHGALRAGWEAAFDAAWPVPEWTPATWELSLYAPATDRLFGTEAAWQGHMESRRYQKAVAELDAAAAETASRKHDRELGWLEFTAARYLDLMGHLVEATIQHVRKKQSRNLRELQNESSDDETYVQPAAAEEDEDDDEPAQKIRNPLNLPLGWDGKPIPYWLYKLHGLGQEFKCEICGNHSYWGRRVFERHFQEWRHAFGMRCLKIPNTLHFKEITKIADAISLYEKLKTETERKSFLVDQEIEVEDPEGNVMTPQTYEDLRKQGII